MKARLLALLAGLLWCASVAAASFDRPYSHYSDQEPLSSLLTDFARSYGYSAQVSGALLGAVSGRFENVSPQDFLQAMNQAYSVRSYQSGQTLYFYHEDEHKRVLFRPVSLSARQLLSMLKSSQIASPSLMPQLENDVLLFTGPQIYVDTLMAAAQQFDNESGRRVVMEVFKLKHAKAQDQQISSMDRTVNLPGIASILKAMVTGGTEGAGSLSITLQQAAQQSLRGQGLAAGPAVVAASVEPQGRGGEDQGKADAQVFTPNIIADSRLNAVLIQDYSYRMPYYRRVIEELDQPLRLIELHAAIVDLDISAARSLGVNWQGGRNYGNWNVGGGIGSPSWDGVIPVSNSGSGGVFSTIFQTDHSAFMAQVEALEEDNKARTLGRPSILTLDNLEATLENTTTRYIPVRGYESSDLFKVESGTVLRVTPHIIDEGDDTQEPLISLVISLQSNEDNDADTTTYITDSGEMYVAPINQTKINTQAVVRQGQSLLLGGYYQQSATESDSGLPGLKDVRFIGGLFGSDEAEGTVRERLLLITPRVVDLDKLTLPSGLDDPRFNVSPTQSDYQMRRPIAQKSDESGGCSSNAVVRSGNDAADAAQLPEAKIAPSNETSVVFTTGTSDLELISREDL